MMNEPRLLVGVVDADDELDATKLAMGAMSQQSCPFPSALGSTIPPMEPIELISIRHPQRATYKDEFSRKDDFNFK